MTPLHTKIMGNSSLPDAQHSSMVVQLDCSHEMQLWSWFNTSWLKFSPVLTIPWYVSYWPLLACTYFFFFLAITLHRQTSFTLKMLRGAASHPSKPFWVRQTSRIRFCEVLNKTSWASFRHQKSVTFCERGRFLKNLRNVFNTVSKRFLTSFC